MQIVLFYFIIFSSFNDDFFRKKRSYGLNVDQDTSLSTINQQQPLPQQFQIGYNPTQVSSYGSINQQQARLLPMTPIRQQFQLPTQSINQPLNQRMSLFEYFILSFFI